MTKLLSLTLMALSICSAATLSYSDTTAGAPVWNRPIANGNLAPTPPVSGVGTAVPFHVFAFSVDTTGSYSFLSIASNNWDNYTFLYGASFEPTAPFTNVLIGNDDNPTIGRSGFNFNLTAGLNYHFITTGFDNGSSGAFRNEISGPGNINPPVPEPATVLLSGLGLAAFAWSRRN